MTPWNSHSGNGRPDRFADYQAAREQPDVQDEVQVLGVKALLSGDFPKQAELRFARRCELVFSQVVEEIWQRGRFKEVQAQDLQYAVK